ncbi:MAG TPA: hypothetical protein VFP12_13605 [Allosphingosinicella sp.]|nr:hypothetical protein [Allosphingosinicella sp.]
MNRLSCLALAGLALFAGPALSQDGGEGEIIVTGTRISGPTAVAVVEQRPVIGLKRQADSAVRRIEIVSDSREADLRQREVQAMLLAALDRAKREGMSLVTGHYEVVEVTRDNWRDAFPALAGRPAVEDEDDDDDDDEDDKPKPGFEDDGSTATVRLMVKTRLEGSIASAQQKIAAFVKGVPATGRSQIEQKGGIALTIIDPDQYRDEIYRLVAAGAKHAASFYGEGYSVKVTGLDRDVGWAQVSNTEIFLYIPYSFTVSK